MYYILDTYFPPLIHGTKGLKLTRIVCHIMLTPNCTLVTACFVLSKYHQGARSKEKALKGIRVVLRLPIYLVIYGDQATLEDIRKERTEFGYDQLTCYKECNYEDIWSAQFTQKVHENRKVYWPTADARTCPESHLVVCNKFDFILQTIEENPFQTSRVGWIDSNLDRDSDKNNKICEDYTENKLLQVLHNCDPDKFHIQVMGCVDKKYKELEHKREYYEHYRWLACGCLVVCGTEIGKRICTRLKEIVKETTLSGYGHGEEMFYLEILDEFRPHIARSYGDYGQILNNFHGLTRNLEYVYNTILASYFNAGYMEDVIDCAKYIIRGFDEHTIEGPVNYGLYISAMRLYVYALQHRNPHRANDMRDNMVKMADTNAKFKDACRGYVV